jgi:hypothetical protein
MLEKITKDVFLEYHEDYNADPYDYQPATDIKIPKKIIRFIQNIMVAKNQIEHEYSLHDYSTLHKIYFVAYYRTYGNHGIAISYDENSLWIRSEFLNFENQKLNQFYKCDILCLEEYLTNKYIFDQIKQEND